MVSNLESLSKLVEKYKFGIIIQNSSNPLEIQLAVEMILGNYQFHSRSAKICFEEEFDFANKVKPILTFITDF